MKVVKTRIVAECEIEIPLRDFSEDGTENVDKATVQDVAEENSFEDLLAQNEAGNVRWTVTTTLLDTTGEAS